MTVEEIGGPLVAILVSALGGLVGGLISYVRTDAKAKETAERVDRLDDALDKERGRVTLMSAAHSMLREEIAGNYVKRDDLREEIRNMREEAKIYRAETKADLQAVVIQIGELRKIMERGP